MFLHNYVALGLAQMSWRGSAWFAAQLIKAALLLLLLLCGAGYAFASFLFVALSSTELADSYVRACACGSAVVLGTFLIQYVALTLIPFGLSWVVALLLCVAPAFSVAALARYCASPDRVTVSDLNQSPRSSGHSHHHHWD